MMKPVVHSPLVRFYLWQGRRWQTLLRMIDGAYTGAWLGLLSPRDLEAADDLHYRRNRTYNGEDHNLSGLMDWEAAAVDQYFRGTMRLAVMGAGGGREVLALERRGHDVDGFECNPALVAFAASFLPRSGAVSKVFYLERDAVPPPSNYDGLIMGWGSYSLINGRERRVDLLRRLRPLVRGGGPLLLSFFTQPEPATRLEMVHRVARFIRLVSRRAPPEAGDDLIPLFVHRFAAAELEAEMATAGFSLVRFEPEGRGKRDSGWAIGLALDPAHAPHDVRPG